MKERVLVVEDEAIVQLDIKNRLINLGYEIAGTAAYGEDAIRKVTENIPDLVLMDIGLKGKIDGIETANQIKALCHVPIIYMTANSDYTTLQKAKITGPFGYILKPFDEREMRTTIEMALYKHNLDTELNETRRLLETTLNSIADAVISTNSDMCMTFMNPAAEAMSGWPAGEAQGKNIKEVIRIIDSETRQEVECPVHKVRETGTPCASKGFMVMISRNGSEYPADCSVSPIFDTKHRIDGFVFVFRDVSEKRTATEALRISETRLARALAIAHMGNWDWDMVKETMWLSDESKKIFGITSDENEFSMDLIKSLFLAEDHDLLCEKIDEIMPESRSATFDFRIRRTDGEIRYLHDEAELFRDRQGNIIRMFGTAQDVTDHILVEQALRESEDKFSQAFNFNPFAMSITTLEEGRFADINRRFTEMFGFTRDDVMGKTSTELGIISVLERDQLVRHIRNTGGVTYASNNFRSKAGVLMAGRTSFDVVLINGKKHLLSIYIE